jgi:hypothetical protein
MRTIECDTCGAPLTAADDSELARRLGEHMRTEHESDVNAEELAALVEDEAYEAMDS